MRLIVELTKYLMIFLLGMYTYYSFRVFSRKDRTTQSRYYSILTAITLSLHFIGYLALYVQIRDMKLVYLYGGELLLFVLILVLYRVLYPKLSRLLLRNMLMLLAIGFIIQTRLSYDKAIRQVGFVAFSFAVGLFIPFIIKHFSFLRRFGWIYGALGILTLIVVFVYGTTNNGATNWLYIGWFSVQPSEFVKLLYVFCIASMFYESINFKKVCAITLMAGANVLILVFQKDLGGALIFFVTYVFMLYSATMKPVYFLGGLAGGSAAAYVAYRLFYHVRVRVMAWQNPMKYIDKEGYQIAQSLFAIGTGGWFGMGLNQGLPNSIPVVDSDFVFSAISEEMGGLFALCIILIYINCFVALINMALKMEDIFYRQLTLGFSVMFSFQVFLSIGGVIKFIPSTGVTLPFISAGGSSMVATIMMFMVLQGIYIKGKSTKKEPEVEEIAEAIERTEPTDEDR